MKLIELLFVAALVCRSGFAASWDVGKDLNTTTSEHTNGALQWIFEIRSRAEYRPGQAYGIEPDLAAEFFRVRAGLSYKPNSWIRLSAVAMDARAPFYGTPAPSSARDPLDLHEGFAEIRADRKTGLGAIVGRTTANYGDTRLIGSPQWAYIPRTYDGGRLFWKGRRFRLEGLLLAPVKLNSAGWNKPVFGERVEGTYNTVTLNKYITSDLYFLRRYQNRAGGFAGVGTLITNSYGTRLFGPLVRNFRYTAEVIGQTGHIGPLPHRANAWVVQVAHKSSLARRPFDIFVEYKYASGTSRTDRSGTFDQLFPAAHDKLGHADVLGWRNVRNIKSHAVWTLTKDFTLNAMYNNSWLANRHDAVYNLQGRAVARSITGTAGSHIGQEADLYFVFKHSGLSFGAGYGYFFNGEFIRRTTPNVSPQFAYLFQSYTF